MTDLQNFYNQKMKKLVEETMQQLDLDDLKPLDLKEGLRRLVQRNKIVVNYELLVNLRTEFKLDMVPDEEEIQKLKCPFCDRGLTEKNGCM